MIHDSARLVRAFFLPEIKEDRGMNESNIYIFDEENIDELSEKLIELIKNRKFSEFRETVESIPAVDIALIFEYIEPDSHVAFFRLLPKELASEVFVEIDSDMQEELINTFTDAELSAILDELYLDDTVDIIEEMPANVVKRLLRASSAGNRNVINRLLKYPKNSAGTIMTTEYVRFIGDMTVERALAHIRDVAIDKETIYTCYITDYQRHLVGIVTAKELLISPLETKLSDIMEDSVISVRTTDDREEAARIFEKYGFIALPVVDAEERLVGIITVDDAIDVIKMEADEDFAKMSAVTPSEAPYMKTSAFSIWKARVPWLLILMFSATISSAILGGFEAALPGFLVIFVPMLMGTGGNSGGQASAMVIRGISVGEIAFSDILRVLWKEIRVGLACGATLGVVSFVKVLLVDRLITGNPEITVTVAFIVSAALALTIFVAKLIGASLPLLAKNVGFDPAVMASPLITTLVDALSLVVYFAVASAFL